MAGISNISSLMTVMQKMREMQGQPSPDAQYAMQDEYLKQNVFPALQSQAQLKNSLEDFNSFLEQNKDNSGANWTGPIAGDYWRVTPEYSNKNSSEGGGLPHPWVSGILNSLFPQDAKVRAGLESRISRMGESAFAQGGKNLTGTELGIKMGPLPSTKVDFEINKSMANENLKTFIPQNIDILRRSIISRGAKPEIADQIISDFMQDHGAK